MLTTKDYKGLAETLGTAIGYHDLVLQRRLDSGRISRNEATEAIQVLQEFQSFMLGTITNRMPGKSRQKSFWISQCQR